MAGEECLQHLAQQYWCQFVAFQLAEGQVQARHMDAACAGGIQADAGVGQRGDAFAAQADRHGDALHAGPVEGDGSDGGLAGDIREGECGHGRQGCF
ncbi:hypothetical protein D3C80_1476090 [compost metagenome]